jgi:XTP/dITP diphosphohydrolase
MSNARFFHSNSVRAPVKLYLASSNPGKLTEYRVLAQTFGSDYAIELQLLSQFATLPAFDESAPTFAENAAGKTIHYSRFHDGFVFADDSGLVVPALGGAPGVHSARYAGPHATSLERNAKLLAAVRGKSAAERQAHFVCAIALAEHGRTRAVVTARVDGEILEAPRGAAGFGYDPVFYFPPLGKAFAEIPAAQKNQYSHRGQAFRKLLSFLAPL